MLVKPHTPFAPRTPGVPCGAGARARRATKRWVHCEPSSTEWICADTHWTAEGTIFDVSFQGQELPYQERWSSGRPTARILKFRAGVVIIASTAKYDMSKSAPTGKVWAQQTSSRTAPTRHSRERFSDGVKCKSDVEVVKGEVARGSL